MTLVRPSLAVLCLALAAAAGAVAQEAPRRGIYACVDAKGRRITSDRPIMECLDREQQQYGEGGTVRATLPPSMTGEERAAAEARARQDKEERDRQAEIRRRDRLLIGRYPSEASHQRERDASLARLDDALASGERRLQDLQQQHEELHSQSGSSATDPVRAPRLKRSLDENEANQAAQRRLLAAQRDERQRIATRFDEELERLKVLWARQAAQPGRPARPASSPKA